MILFDETLERISQNGLESLQKEKLVELCNQLEGRNHFYGEKLKPAGIQFSDMKTLEDLQNVPFTTESELMEAQDKSPRLGPI